MSTEVFDIDDSSDIHVRQDNSSWPFIMFFGGRMVAADTRTELVEHLIPGYSALPHDEDGDLTAFTMRGIQSVATANMLQEMVAGLAVIDETFDYDNATETELTAFFTSRADNPTVVAGVDHWDHPVPLILVTSFYEPHADVSPTTGNVMWIDPTNETTYLDSLHALGQVRLFVSSDSAL